MYKGSVSVKSEPIFLASLRLRIIFAFSLSDETYVKSVVLSDERILSRRQTGFHKCKLDFTDFSETFSIPLKKKELERSALLLQLLTHNTESGLSGEVGRCCVGALAYARGSGLAHWSDMALYRNSDILRTHNLC